MSRRRSRGSISNPAYHWRRVLCIWLMEGGRSEVERIVVIVCVVVGDEGCELVIMVYVKDSDWVK